MTVSPALRCHTCATVDPALRRHTRASVDPALRHTRVRAVSVHCHPAWGSQLCLAGVSVEDTVARTVPGLVAFAFCAFTACIAGPASCRPSLRSGEGAVALGLGAVSRQKPSPSPWKGFLWPEPAFSRGCFHVVSRSRSRCNTSSGSESESSTREHRKKRSR